MKITKFQVGLDGSYKIFVTIFCTACNINRLRFKNNSKEIDNIFKAQLIVLYINFPSKSIFSVVSFYSSKERRRRVGSHKKEFPDEEKFSCFLEFKVISGM